MKSYHIFVSNINVKRIKDMENLNKRQNLTLAGYYNGLKRPPSPKLEFIKDIAENCGVGHLTVRNWIQGRNLPSNPEHKTYISKITGIPVEQLWNR